MFIVYNLTPFQISICFSFYLFFACHFFLFSLGPPAGPPQQGYQQPQYPGYPPASQQSPYPQSQGTPDYPQQPAYPQQPQAGSTAPYPTNDQKGPGKGMFSGKGLLGQAMGMGKLGMNYFYFFIQLGIFPDHHRL
jgi:hypothetical protein